MCAYFFKYSFRKLTTVLGNETVTLIKACNTYCVIYCFRCSYRSSMLPCYVRWVPCFTRSLPRSGEATVKSHPTLIYTSG